MIGYARDEILSSSKASKRLGEILTKLRKRELRRLVLTRNNRLEAVILPIEDYEELIEDLDHLVIATELKERMERDTGKRIPWEKLKKKYGL